MSPETDTEQSSIERRRIALPNGRKLIGLAVGTLLLVVVCLFFFNDNPDDSRIRRSLNNVKNLDLGQKNYAANHDGLFATPTLFNDDGRAVHGWVTQLLPMLDNTILYEQIDLSRPWNDPANQEYSKVPLSMMLNPSLDIEQNSDGYPLMHYTLNTRLFPNNESLTEDYVSHADGLANTILLGEIQEGLPAWAETGNARDPAKGLKSGPDTMGVSVWGGETIIGFADGRAIIISNDIDPAVLKALSTPDGGEEILEDW